MILPLLGTIAKGAIKGMVGRRRRKKGEGAQVSSSIVKVNKNKGDKKSGGLVKPTTPMFGGSKEVSTLSSSSIMEALDNIDNSIATIKKILIIESKFKSKVAADNIKAQNLLMKRNEEKKLKSSKTSTSITGKSISKIGSWLSRFLPFVVATLLGSVVLAVYNGLSSIIKFFQGIFKALNGFFAALDPYVRPILDFFNLFKKQDTGELDPKIGETEEEQVNKLEGQMKELDEQSDVFVKEFNKQKKELLEATIEYQKSVEVSLNEINNNIAQSNTPQDTEEIVSNDSTDTPEVIPTVSMVNTNNVNLNQVSDKSLNRGSFRPTTPLVTKKDDGKKEEDKSLGNNISADKFFIDGKPPTIAGLRELEESDMNARFKNQKIRNYKMKLDAYNQKMYGGTDAIEVNGKTYEPGDSNYGIALELQKATIGKNTEKQWELRQTLIKLEDQAFYETNQTKTNIVFVPQKNSEVASSGGGIILMGGSSKKSILNSKSNPDLLDKLYVG